MVYFSVSERYIHKQLEQKVQAMKQRNMANHFSLQDLAICSMSLHVFGTNERQPLRFESHSLKSGGAGLGPAIATPLHLEPRLVDS